MTLRPRVWTLATAVIGSLVTLSLMQAQSLHFAYRAFGLHVGLEVTASFIAFLAAHLMYGRYREDARLDDLALACALGILGCANFFLAAIPAAASNGRPERFSTWAPLLGRLIGEMVFAYAAFAPRRRLEHPRRAAALAFGGGGAALIAIALLVSANSAHLPAGVNPSMSPSAVKDPFSVGPAPLLVVQAFGFCLYAAAAVGFTRRAERRHDELMLWLAVGAVLAAISRWNYLLYPSLYSPWLYSGDAFRLASYTVLWLGAAREIGSYWRTRAAHAVLEERRRLARELHDGLAQELGFIVTRARALEEENRKNKSIRVLASAAERALDESRRAIIALTNSRDEPLEAAVAQAAEEVAGRSGARLRLQLDRDVTVSAETREALVRIVREAVGNAARHGKAQAIRIELANHDGIRLRIEDDGVGFDPDRPRSRGGFGLVSMRERARAIGAELSVASSRNHGTTVEVILP